MRSSVGDQRALTGLVFLASAVVLAAVRAWQIAGREALWWNDSADFLASARTGLFSLERWAGLRTAAAPLVLSLARFEPGTYVTWQAAVAVVCWAALATSLWTVMGEGRARWVGALAVVAFACTVPVTMWERSVLSESLATSTLALVLAAVLQLARGVRECGFARITEARRCRVGSHRATGGIHPHWPAGCRRAGGVGAVAHHP